MESSNSSGPAARYCLKAIEIECKVHVVLINAEVDLVFGCYLQHQARKQEVIVTSDAGDQHDVLNADD